MLIDAAVVLLVRLHLAGVFWGDCSLSNVLFRRDGGAMMAYLVDAETAEKRPSINDQLRAHDLEIAYENVVGGLLDLQAAERVPTDVGPGGHRRRAPRPLRGAVGGADPHRPVRQR